MYFQYFDVVLMHKISSLNLAFHLVKMNGLSIICLHWFSMSLTNGKKSSFNQRKSIFPCLQRLEDQS